MLKDLLTDKTGVGEKLRQQDKDDEASESALNDLLCWIGFHQWEFSLYLKSRNCAAGNRCINCKTWHKGAVKWRT